MSGYGDGVFGECVFGDGQGGHTMRNLGFEEGTHGRAGGARAWQVEGSTAFGSFAGFGIDAAEDFERSWSNRPFHFELPDDAVPALFSASVYVVPRDVEDFERGWNNFPFADESFAAIVALFSSGESFDGFEDGWSNDTYLVEFAGPELTGLVVDDFESGWDNDDYAVTWAGGVAAEFYGVRALTVEGFQHVKAPQVYTGSTTLDTILTIGHGLALNYRVVFAIPIAGALPSPIAPSVDYYVQNVPDANGFAVALTAGAGSPIDLTTAGSGLLRWSAPYEFWTTLLGPV